MLLELEKMFGFSIEIECWRVMTPWLRRWSWGINEKSCSPYLLNEWRKRTKARSAIGLGFVNVRSRCRWSRVEVKRSSVTNFMLRLLCLNFAIKIRSRENGLRYLEGSEGVIERGDQNRGISKERVSGLRSDRERIIAIKIRLWKIVLRGEIIWEELEAFETLDLDSM